MDPIDQSVPTVLTSRFVDAVSYAVGLHLDQVRKGSGVPYAGHLLGVCSLVVEAGGGEDEAIAALLHDAGEDRGGEAQLATIRERFGENVAGIVRGCSDSLLESRPDWKTRKDAYSRTSTGSRRGAARFASGQAVQRASNSARLP